MADNTDPDGFETLSDETIQAFAEMGAGSVPKMLLHNLKNWMDQAEALSKGEHTPMARLTLSEMIWIGLIDDMRGVISFACKSVEGRQDVADFVEKNKGSYDSGQALRCLSLLLTVNDLFKSRDKES